MTLLPPGQEATRIMQRWADSIAIEAMPGLHQDITAALTARDVARIRPITLLPFLLMFLGFVVMGYGLVWLALVIDVVAIGVGIRNLATAT